MSDNMPVMNGNGGPPLEIPKLPGDPPIPTELATTTPVGTDFKAVAIGAGANLEGLPAYFADPLLGTGNMPGLAISAFNNRAIRQGTFVASSLCLWISGQIQQYIYDNGDQINWMANWQQALANFVTALIPAGPNLGAYLPLAGGTMVGHIRFQSGISTILANNTWYFGLDTAGNPRGLILKGSDNNVYINDGSAPFVMFNGIPVINNNVSWNGKDTSGTAHALIGILSDNYVHIAGGANLYVDIGTAWFQGNIVISNNYFYYCKDTGGAPRNVVGINTGNSLLIGSGGIGTTDIYAGGSNAIYLHNTTYALGVFQVNGYLYSQGGGRAYIPGGNDPWQIYADHGYYARIYYTTAGTRSWTCGVYPSGIWSINDETAAAVRLQIDLSGNITTFGALAINGGLTAYNGANVASGNLNCAQITVQGGTYSYGGLNVWNGLVVNSGNATFAGNVQAAYVGSSGNIAASGWVTAYGTAQGGYVYSTGNMACAGQFNSNTVYSNYINSAGNADIASTLGVGGNVNCNNTVSSNATYTSYIMDYGGCQINGTLYVPGGQTTVQHLSANNGFCLGGAAFNFDYTWGAPIGNHMQFVSGLGIYAQFFSAYSDERLKRNISSVERDALAAIKPLQFYSYDVPRVTPEGEIIDARSHVALGFTAQQVQASLPDAVIETDMPVKFNMDHPETGDVGCDWETQPTLAIDLATMLAYSLRAIQQLTERLEQVEGKLH